MPCRFSFSSVSSASSAHSSKIPRAGAPSADSSVILSPSILPFVISCCSLSLRPRVPGDFGTVLLEHQHGRRVFRLAVRANRVETPDHLPVTFTSAKAEPASNTRHRTVRIGPPLESIAPIHAYSCRRPPTDCSITQARRVPGGLIVTRRPIPDVLSARDARPLPSSQSTRTWTPGGRHDGVEAPGSDSPLYVRSAPKRAGWRDPGWQSTDLCRRRRRFAGIRWMQGGGLIEKTYRRSIHQTRNNRSVLRVCGALADVDEGVVAHPPSYKW
jgi:hypothetical protein